MAWTTPVTQSTGTLITAATWNAQVTDNMIHLATTHAHAGASGDGADLSTSFVPTGAIAIFDTSCPSGWTRVSAFDGKFLRGASSYGGTGGADTHTHTVASHTHTSPNHAHSLSTGAVASGTGAYGVTSSTTASDASGTTGAASPATNAGSSLPSYIEVVFCKRN